MEVHASWECFCDSCLTIEGTPYVVRWFNSFNNARFRSVSLQSITFFLMFSQYIYFPVVMKDYSQIHFILHSNPKLDQFAFIFLFTYYVKRESQILRKQ